MADWTSRKEYFDSVRGIAKEAVARAEDEDDLHDEIHQSVDGNEWVIYTAGNIGVMQFSDADLNLPFDELGSDFLSGVDSMPDLLQKAAYFYMLSDVNEHAWPLWEDKEAGLDEDEDED